MLRHLRRLLRFCPSKRFLCAAGAAECRRDTNMVPAAFQQLLTTAEDNESDAASLRDNWAAVLASIPEDTAQELLRSPSFKKKEDNKMEFELSSEVVDKIVAVRPTSEQSAVVWCRMLCRVFEGVDHLSDRQAASLRDALVGIVPRVSQRISAFWWCAALSASVKKLGEVKTIFCVPAMRDVLIQMHPLLVADEARHSWLGAVAVIVEASKRAETVDRVFATPALRDCVVRAGQFDLSPLAAAWWCSCVARLTWRDQTLFARNDVYTRIMELHSVILDGVKQKKNEIVSAKVAHNFVAQWCGAVARLSETEVTAKTFFATQQMHDSLVQLYPFVTSLNSARWWCAALQNVVVSSNKKSQDLFGTESMRDALLEVEPHVSTHDASRAWLTVISNLTAKNVTVKRCFATERIRDAVLHQARVIPDASQTSMWCAAWCSVVSHLVSSCFSGRYLFATSAFRDMLMSMWMQLTDTVAVRWWCSAVNNLVADSDRSYPDAQQLFQPEIKAALLHLAPLVTTPDSCHLWAAVVAQLTRDNAEMKKKIACVEIRDALLTVREHATIVLAARWWCSAVSNILTMMDETPKKIFSTPAFCRALVSIVNEVSLESDGDDLCAMWCGAVSTLCADNPAARSQLATAEVRDIFLSLRSHIKSFASIVMWCSAVSNVVGGQPDLERQVLFGTPEMRDALVSIQPLARTDHGCRSWCVAISNLCAQAPAVQNIFQTVAMRDALIRQAKFVTKFHHALWWCVAVSHLCCSAQKMFATPEMRDALVSIALIDYSVRELGFFVSVMFSLTVDNIESQKLFATLGIKNGLMKCGRHLQTEQKRRMFRFVVRNLAFSSATARCHFEDALQMVRKTKGS